MKVLRDFDTKAENGVNPMCLADTRRVVKGGVYYDKGRVEDRKKVWDTSSSTLPGNIVEISLALLLNKIGNASTALQVLAGL